MKKLNKPIPLFVCCLLHLAPWTYAQHILSGKFTDKDAQPLAYLEIIASRGDSVLAGTLTDSSGVFKLKLPSGEYRLEAMLLHDKLYEKTIVLTRSRDLGTLSVRGLQLGEVAVAVKKRLFEQKVDRLVFNIGNSIAASGGDMLDALRITPGIQLQDDGIALIGKGVMRVMVDDRLLPLQGEALMQFLESIPADDIKRIEVITTPPARYEAEGDSGLINIVYKRGRRDHWSAELRGSYRNNTFPYYKAGTRFSYRKNKWSLALNLQGTNATLSGVDTAYTYYPHGRTWFETTDHKTHGTGLSSRLALDYEATRRTTLGVLYFGYTSDFNPRELDLMRFFNPAQRLESVIKTDNRAESLRDNYALNLHYLFKPDTTGKTYAVNLDYFSNQQNANAGFESQDTLRQPVQSVLKADNNSQQHVRNYSAKVDVTQPAKWFDLAYGAKLNFTQSDNLYDFIDKAFGKPVPDPDQSDQFQYSENTQALYLSASKKLNERWQGKLGLRLENTQTKGVSKTTDQTHKNHYVKLFPTFYLVYSPNAAHAFSFSYGRRIKRPSYRFLDAHRWYFSGTSYVVGNPALQPSFTHDFTLSHTWKKMLTSKLHFYSTRGGFAQLPNFNAETGQQIYTNENFYAGSIYSLEESASLKPCPWWQSQAALHLAYVNYHFDPAKLSNPRQASGAFAYLSTDNSFFFNRAHTFTGALNFSYTSRKKEQIDIEEPVYILDLGLKVLLLDEDLQIALNGRDLLAHSRAYQTIYVNDVKQVSRYDPYIRGVTLSVNFRIGNKKVKVKQRAFGNQEEQNRS